MIVELAQELSHRNCESQRLSFQVKNLDLNGCKSTKNQKQIFSFPLINHRGLPIAVDVEHVFRLV